MSFFYNLNDKLNAIREKPEVTHKQLNERDEGKPGKNFAKIAKDAGERYGSKEAGERVAGAVRNKLRDQGKLEEEGMSRAAKGYEKYGREGMEALAKAGRDGKALDPVRKKYNKYDNTEVDEGVMDTVKSVGKKVASGINKLVGHGSDEDMRKDVQRKSGAPVTGKKPEQKTTEAAKYRDPKYKDKLYTVEPLDYTYGPDADELYYNPKPDDYEGRKRKIGGGEFSHNDPLRKGFGRGGASNSINTHGKRKGLPSRDQITSLKGSIKDASGTHAEPNLPEAGAPMTDKQKSFAKLAPPADKITFADKIAGAKKEVDEMLGDVAAEAMRAALGKGKQTVQGMAEDQPTHFEVHYKDNQKGRTAKTKVKGSDAKQAKAAWNDWNSSNTPGRFTFVAAKPVATEMDEEKSKGTAFDMSTPRAATPKVGSIERGHKHDIKHTATGRMVTRRVDDQGNSVGADDDSAASGEKRGRGRPKGTTGAIGAKGPSGRSKLMTKEGADQGQAQQVVDDLAELRAAAKQAQRGGEFPQGFASQLEVVLYAAMTLIKNQQPGDAQVREEEKTSTRDDHAEKAGKKVTKDIEYDEKKKDGIHGKKRGSEDAKAEKAGKKVAKDIEYDEKKKDKKEEEVDESTTSGSVATSTATKSSKSSMVGKGIYDSMNRELENMIAESMSINMSDSTEGGKSLSITATDEDALKLGMLLKSAGLGGGDAHGGDMHSHGEEACDTCGMPDCGCGDVQEAVDENSPDWPTNTETSPDALQYSGGLNKPKTDVAGDGQTTVPNSAVHTQDEDALRRMMEMAGIKQAELEPWKETMKEAAEEELDEAAYEPLNKFFKPGTTDAERAASNEKGEKSIIDTFKKSGEKAKPGSVVHALMKKHGEKVDEGADDVEEDFLESIQRMREIAGIQEAKKQVDQNGDGKNDFEDIKIARMKASGAIDDKEEKKVDESIFALNNQWQAYKG
jgi:hypothetical protein